MDALRELAGDLSTVAHRDAVWMTWNLLLAMVPLVLAPLVFRHRGPRTALWWTGLGLFALFLPNAPYVITDLVHLRADVLWADDDRAVLTAVLPVYAVFIGLGVVSYTLCLREVGRYVERIGRAGQRAAIELGVHAAAAVGVVLGRFARLNSWEPVTEPHGTLERIALTLSARWAVAAVLVMFVVIWAAHAVTRTLLDALGTGVRRVLRAAA